MTYSRPGVYISERLLPAPIAAAGTANAAAAAIGAFSRGPEEVTLITSWYDFVNTFGGHSNAYPATFGISSFFQNGGSELYVRRVLSEDAASSASPIAPATGSTAVGTITAKNKGVDGNNIRFQFSASAISGLWNLSVYREGGASSADVSAGNDVLVETFTNVSISDSLSSDYIVNVVSLNSKLITVSIEEGDITPSTARIPLVGGSDGEEPPVAEDYTLVLPEFETVDRPLVIFAPEITTALGDVDGKTVQDAVVSWASGADAFAVLDTPAGLDVATALTYASGFDATSFAAVYYPHFFVKDALGRSATSLRKVGPAGAIVGLYLSTDRAAGPFKAPAGVTANIRGAVALEKSFTNTELDSLNAATSPINAIRNIPGSGVVSMGARTLLQDGTANKYINMRRSLIFIKKSLNNLSQFALFENNNEDLWRQINTVFDVFLNDYRNQGGLRGNTAAQSYFIKVDAENNTPESIANGEVHIEVGVALQYPAEFVIINLSQQTAI